MTSGHQVSGAMRVLEIEEMSGSEASSVLQRVGYGHLGCARENQPYVIPVHYIYDPPSLYIYTTRGMKTEFIASNPAVCLQVEEVRDAHNWRSVIVMGRAGLLTDSAEREKANNLIALINPSHAPAISKTAIGASVRQNMVEIYRIDPQIMSGRKTRRAQERD